MAHPTVSMAFSIYSNKGAYALLLGSGISTGAGIKTGWEMRREFIQRAAELVGEAAGEDPDAWFVQHFEKPATYSNVLEAIDPSKGGRAGLLRSYFEPTEEDRDNNRKVPAAAHHAIASLVSRGYIRVVLTTNFDHLLEQALDAASVPYQVITSPDDIDGARPFIVEPCTIIKVNGDFKDIRFKNTEDELREYDSKMHAYLQRALEEFGLIVCGWSGESDPALMGLVCEHQSTLFGTFCTYRSSLKPSISDVLNVRRGQAIKIEGADQFFRQFDEHVTALERALDQQPVDARAVFDTVKRYVGDERHNIALEDLLVRQTRELLAALPDHTTPGNHHQGDIREQVATYEALTERLRAAMVAGCAWGKERHAALWSRLITQLAALPGEEYGNTTRPDRRLYPALLLLYTGGIAAVAKGRYDNLAAVLVKAQARNTSGQSAFRAAILEVYGGDILYPQQEQLLSSGAAQYGPLSYYLHDRLRSQYDPLVVRPEEYDLWFDRFEYLAMLVSARLHWQETNRLWAPRAKIILRGHRGELERRQLIEGVLDEARAAGESWGAITAGLFASLEEFEALVEETRKWADNW